MTNSNKISGSRTLKKGSKKSIHKKSNTKKNNNLDFSNILNDMEDSPQMGMKAHSQNMEGMSMQPMSMQPMSMQPMPGMQMPGMPDMSGMSSNNMAPMMQQMNMNQMGMDQMGMAQMNMPQMGMPQMMMGVDPKNVDPLHLYSFVPQNENLNINNYGVGSNQLMSGSQMTQSFNSRSAPASQGPIASLVKTMNKFLKL